MSFILCYSKHQTLSNLAFMVREWELLPVVPLLTAHRTLFCKWSHTQQSSSALQSTILLNKYLQLYICQSCCSLKKPKYSTLKFTLFLTPLFLRTITLNSIVVILRSFVLIYQCNVQVSTSKMVQLADMFSVPEMSLLCNIAEYFEKSGIDYHPEILFRDVKVSPYV